MRILVSKYPRKYIIQLARYPDLKLVENSRAVTLTVRKGAGQARAAGAGAGLRTGELLLLQCWAQQAGGWLLADNISYYYSDHLNGDLNPMTTTSTHSQLLNTCSSVKNSYI